MTGNGQALSRDPFAAGPVSVVCSIEGRSEDVLTLVSRLQIEDVDGEAWDRRTSLPLDP